jgi:hypothetical protein
VFERLLAIRVILVVTIVRGWFTSRVSKRAHSSTLTRSSGLSIPLNIRPLACLVASVMVRVKLGLVATVLRPVSIPLLVSLLALHRFAWLSRSGRARSTQNAVHLATVGWHLVVALFPTTSNFLSVRTKFGARLSRLIRLVHSGVIILEGFSRTVSWRRRHVAF